MVGIWNCRNSVLHIQETLYHKYFCGIKENTHNLCEPRSSVIVQMAKTLNTTVDFIVGITVDPAPAAKDQSHETEAKNQTRLTHKLRRLTSENQAKIEERIDMLTELQKNEK